jgi:SAM-dependent methyltransferase
MPLKDCASSDAANLLPACLCGSTKAAASVMHDIDVLTCDSCGVVRQRVPMTSKQYRDYYAFNYYGVVYSHSPEQDRDTAAKRLEAHGGYLKGRILDIGSGTGAFVLACRDAGLEAWGQDLGVVGPGRYTYVGELQDHSFPAGWADVVTMHDVLEHLPDPVATLLEVRRILKPGGTLIVDFPSFHTVDGHHHWKKTEHLWMLTSLQLVGLLAQTGFQPQQVDHPIPGKHVLYAERRLLEQDKKRILVPSGIGDIFWIMTKLRGFMAEQGITLPEIWIDTPSDDRKRSFQYVERLPFVRAGGYHQTTQLVPTDAPLAGWARRRGGYLDAVRKEAYHRDARNIFAEVEGFDWFISVNGAMNAGRSLDGEIMPQYPVEWGMPMFVSMQERAYGQALRDAYGDYVVTAFFSEGKYGRWLMQMPPEVIYGVLCDINAMGLRVLLTGAAWDRDSKINVALRELDRRNGILVDMIGETTLEEYFGAVRSAAGCIGFPAGNTIMSAAFGKPTAIIWHDLFDRRMHVNACPPVDTYAPLNTALHDRAAVVAAFSRLISPAAKAA